MRSFRSYRSLALIAAILCLAALVPMSSQTAAPTRAPNTDAIGARVRVATGSRTQFRDVKAGSSYLSQNDLRAHFGLGPAARADRVEVKWPSGRTDTFTDVPANQIVTIEEG